MPEQGAWWWDARHPSQGGTGGVSFWGQGMSPDVMGYYKIVADMLAAQQALNAGQFPLLYTGQFAPPNIQLDVLRQLQQEQYAAPEGVPLFIPGQRPGAMMVNPDVDERRVATQEPEGQ